MKRNRYIEICKVGDIDLVKRLEDCRSREQDGQRHPQDHPAHPLAGFCKQKLCLKRRYYRYPLTGFWEQKQLYLSFSINLMVQIVLEISDE